MDISLIRKAIKDISKSSLLEGQKLLRCYYYDAAPFKGVKTDPNGTKTDFSKTPQCQNMQKLHDDIKLSNDLAFRCGDLKFRGWKIIQQDSNTSQQTSQPKYAPILEQKGVDIKIGLDISTMSMKRIINTVVIFSGDADLAPAMKMARKEGLRVYYVNIQSGWIANEIKIHSDNYISL